VSRVASFPCAPLVSHGPTILRHILTSTQPSQLASRVGNGIVWRHCLVRCTGRGMLSDVIKFGTASSACEKAGFVIILVRIASKKNIEDQWIPVSLPRAIPPFGGGF